MSPRFLALEFLVLFCLRLGLQWRGGEQSRPWKRMLDVTIGLGLVVFLFVHYVMGLYRVTSRSMQPTLEPWDILVVTHYRRGYLPRRGDIVLFQTSSHDSALVKRVVALPGDRVEGKEGKLWLNGQACEEPYLLQVGATSTFPLHVVSSQGLFLMGDNRSNSSDSRVFGEVSRAGVLGRAESIIWPPSHCRELVGGEGKKEIQPDGANGVSGQEQSR